MTFRGFDGFISNLLYYSTHIYVHMYVKERGLKVQSKSGFSRITSGTVGIPGKKVPQHRDIRDYKLIRNVSSIFW